MAKSRRKEAQVKNEARIRKKPVKVSSSTFLSEVNVAKDFVFILEERVERFA